MPLLDDLKKSPHIRSLLEKNSDAFELSFAVRLKYMKAKGKEKPLLLVVTKLNAYALKPTFEVIKKFSLDKVVLKLETGRLNITNKHGELLFTMHGERQHLVDATATIRDLAQKLVSPMAVKAKPSAKFTPSQSSSLARPYLSRASRPVDEDEEKETRTSKHEFLIQNIVNADEIDYQGIRSLYPNDSDSNDTSVSLIDQLSKFIHSRDQEVEDVVSTSSTTFFEAVQDCEAVKPGVSQQLHKDVVDISEKVTARTQALLAAGGGVRKYQLEYTNIKDSISHIEMCQASAALHTKAEKFVSERKFYPAVLALDELELKVRPLLRHAYGKWVFDQSIPELRKRIRTEIQQDFNKWMSSARVIADPIGTKALAWARERILTFDKSGREIELVDTYDDVPQQRAGRPRLERRASSMFDITSQRGTITDGTETSANSVSDHDEDWADDLVWDVRVGDNTRRPVRGAAQLLAQLTDMLIAPHQSQCCDKDSESPPQSPSSPATPASTVDDDGGVGSPRSNTGGDVTFKVVHQNMCVTSCLDPANGLDTLRQYYLTNRQRQLQLRLTSPKSVQDVMSPKWLSGLAGFFLVDLIVTQSTYPPLVQEFHILGFWDQTVQVLQTWLEKAAREVTSWEDLLALKERCHELAVALEELWAVAGDCSYRLDPLYEGITSVRRAAMERLHDKTITDISTIMGKEEKFKLLIPPRDEHPDQVVKKKNSLPGIGGLYPPNNVGVYDPEAVCKKYFLHLSNGGKCCITVVQVMDVLTSSLNASLDLTRGAGDVDDEVRGQMESLLQIVAAQLDERGGKLQLSQIYPVQICMLAVNAGAYDAAALSLAKTFAQRASSNYLDENGRLAVFSNARRRFRECQIRLENSSISMSHSKIKTFMDLSPNLWSPVQFKAHKPLSDLTFFLSNRWKQRSAMIPDFFNKRMQASEIYHLVACLTALFQRIVNSESIQLRYQTLQNLDEDIDQIRKLCEPNNLELSKQFEVKLKAAIEAERNAPTPPPKTAPPVQKAKTKGGFADFLKRNK